MKRKCISVICIVVVVLIFYLIIAKNDSADYTNCEKDVNKFMTINKFSIEDEGIFEESWKNKNHFKNQIICLNDYPKRNIYYVQVIINNISEFQVGDLIEIKENDTVNRYNVQQIEIKDFSKIKQANDNEIIVIFSLGESTTYNLVITAIRIN